MRVGTKLVLAMTATLLVGFLSFAQTQKSSVLWLDFDMKDIGEPKERAGNYYEYFIKGQLLEGTKQQLDVPRWLRMAAGEPKQASNVNALDEVPNSSWYTNRHRLRRMSSAELQRGPNRGNAPDFSTIVVTKAKTGGVTPGLMVKDATGQAYLVKFDSADYPNLRSGAEVIATKILHAAGYNVPENYIAYFDSKNLEIGQDVMTTDVQTKRQRPLTLDDVNELLSRVARTADGRYRALASQLIEGKPKGPFPQVGLRLDDPNDLIPHEHRRELRGMRAISSWINNWDLKESQSLDVYVNEGGRNFLRHYLLDFGSALGADDIPTDYYHGFEYGFDPGSITKEIFSLGLYETAREKKNLIISPEVGGFTAVGFKPGKWKPTYSAVMFANMTDQDAFWATRIILSFSEQDLRSIIETAEYSGPTTNNYILQTLLDRQRMVARYWLSKTDALSDFSIEGAGDGVALKFRDLMMDLKFVVPGSTHYTYQVKGARFKSEKTSVEIPVINLDRETLAQSVEHGQGNPIEVSIWPYHENSTSGPVKVYFDWSPTLDVFVIRRISRG